MTDNTGKNTQRLEEMLKPHLKEFDVLKEALREVSQEEAEGRKGKAKDLIRKAMELDRQMKDLKAKFNGETKKFDKELGKTLNRLQNMANNRPLDAGEGEGEDGEKEESSDE